MTWGEFGILESSCCMFGSRVVPDSSARRTLALSVNFIGVGFASA